MRYLLAVAWLGLAVGWFALAVILADPWVSIPFALICGGCLDVGLVLLVLGWPSEWL